MAKNKAREMAAYFAQKTKASRRAHYEEVMSKEKVTTYDDIIGLYYGLTEKSRKGIVYQRIYELFCDGFSPKESWSYCKKKK